MWLWLGFALLICALVWDGLLKRKRQQVLKASRIPGPALTWPLIGDVIETVGNDTLSKYLFKSHVLITGPLSNANSSGFRLLNVCVCVLIWLLNIDTKKLVPFCIRGFLKSSSTEAL